jgi:hypothetical protein
VALVGRQAKQSKRLLRNAQTLQIEHGEIVLSLAK